MPRAISDRIDLAAIAGCVAVGALAFAGCGGGSSSSTSGASGSALTKAEFVSRGNAICKKNNAKIEAIKVPRGGPQGVPYLTQLAALNKAAANQFGALSPPGSLLSDYLKLLRLIEAKQKGVDKLLAAVKAHNASEAKAAFKQLEATTTQNSVVLGSLGLTDCLKRPQG